MNYEARFKAARKSDYFPADQPQPSNPRNTDVYVSVGYELVSHVPFFFEDLFCNYRIIRTHYPYPSMIEIRFLEAGLNRRIDN